MRKSDFVYVLRLFMILGVALLTAVVIYQQYFLSQYSTSSAQTTTVVSTFSPVADTYVNKTYSDRNYGGSKTLILKDSNLLKTALLKFDLSTLAGKNVVSAKLRLKIVDASKDIQNYKLISNTSWDERTITLNNAPSLTGTVIGTTTNTTVGAWAQIDVLSAVTQRQGKLMTLIVDSSHGIDIFGFASRESTDKPQLIITSLSSVSVAPTLTPVPPTPTTPPFISPVPTVFVPTATRIPTPTPTLRPTATPTPILTSAIGPTATPTLKPTSTPLPTSTPRPTTTPTPLPTSTPVPPILYNPPTPVPTSNPVPPQGGGQTYYVATNGSDSNSGDFDSPFKTVTKGLVALRPGDTLYVRGGTYVENVKPGITAGTASNPIKVLTYPGERPVIQGLLWFTSGNFKYWYVSGLNVTWSSSNGSGDHMVKFTGSNWTFTNAEIWNAHSYAGVQVSGGANNWTLSNLYIHDTIPSNSTNQDHLIYVNDANNGVIERCLLANSANGRGVKLGPPSGGSAGPNNITIRYNTFYNNLGPANIQLSYGSNNNKMYRNILVKSGSGMKNITNNSLNGAGNNLAYQNIGYLSTGVVESDSAYLIDGGGNQYLDPQLTSYDPAASGYLTPRAGSPAEGYGKYAP